MKSTTAQDAPLSALLCLHLLAWALILQPMFLLALSAQAVPLPGSNPEATWTSDKATHLIGLPELKPKLQGTLSLSPAGLLFKTTAGETRIDRARILSLSIGDERAERGGRLGKFARSAIPYGGGAAMAAVSGTQIDLLTVEFRDERGAYHGAVFSLPWQQALHAQEQFVFPPPVLATGPPPACPAGSVRPSTLRVDDIDLRGQPLPVEYRVLLYEHLIRRLQDQIGLQAVYRQGDRSDAAACPQFALSLTVTAFAKGNAVLRASTGPLGMFLGVTRLNFDMVLRGDKGNLLLDKTIKASQRGDTESLDIADEVAKSITRKIKKANRHHHE